MPSPAKSVGSARGKSPGAPQTRSSTPGTEPSSSVPSSANKRKPSARRGQSAEPTTLEILSLLAAAPQSAASAADRRGRLKRLCLGMAFILTVASAYLAGFSRPDLTSDEYGVKLPLPQCPLLGAMPLGSNLVSATAVKQVGKQVGSSLLTLVQRDYLQKNASPAIAMSYWEAFKQPGDGTGDTAAKKAKAALAEWEKHDGKIVGEVFDAGISLNDDVSSTVFR